MYINTNVILQVTWTLVNFCRDGPSVLTAWLMKHNVVYWFWIEVFFLWFICSSCITDLSSCCCYCYQLCCSSLLLDWTQSLHRPCNQWKEETVTQKAECSFIQHSGAKKGNHSALHWYVLLSWTFLGHHHCHSNHPHRFWRFLVFSHREGAKYKQFICIAEFILQWWSVFIPQNLVSIFCTEGMVCVCQLLCNPMTAGCKCTM